MEAQTARQRELSVAPSAYCRNCGTALEGRFCHRCGQKQRNRILPLSQLLVDSLGEYFLLDHRLFGTLRKLLFAPGRLTEAYLRGQRARFTKPFRLYLLVSATYFVVQAFVPQANVFFGGILKGRAATGATLRTWLPRLMFLLLPAFALLLKGFYARHHRLYVEHLVFSLHFFSFYFAINLLLAPLRALTAAIGVEWLALGLSAIVLVLGLIAPAAYLVLATRRVYEHTLAWSLAKGTVLYIGYFVLIGLAVAALQVAGVIG